VPGARALAPLTEVATAALLYGRAPSLKATITLWQAPAGHHLIVVGVTDANPNPPIADQSDPGEPGHGRGLHLLHASTDGCGWHPEGQGKTIWFSLTTGDDQTSGHTKGTGWPAADGPGELHQPSATHQPAPAR
jgi:hypothetical protein